MTVTRNWRQTCKSNDRGALKDIDLEDNHDT